MITLNRDQNELICKMISMLEDELKNSPRGTDTYYIRLDIKFLHTVLQRQHYSESGKKQLKELRSKYIKNGKPN